MAALRRAGVRDVVLCSSDDPAPYAGLIRAEKKEGTRVLCSRETEQLGTGGALRNAEAFLRSFPFFSMNGDLLTDLDFSKMLKFHKSKRSALTISLIPMKDPSRYGVLETDRDGRVLKFVEKPVGAGLKPARAALINGGIYLMEREVLKMIPKGRACSLERDIFPEMIRLGRPVYGYVSGAYWVDIGTPDKYLQGNLDVASGRMRPALPKSARPKIAKGIRVPKSARVGRGAVIGKGCVVGEGAILKDCVLLPGARVADGETVQNSIIDRNCRIDL